MASPYMNTNEENFDNFDYAYNSNQPEYKNNFDFKAFFAILLKKWYWFVISIGVALALGCIYLASTPSEYTRTAKILIKEDNTGLSNTSASDFLFGRSKVNIDNEISVFKSARLMKYVVSRLSLNNSYTIDQPLRTDEIYKAAPIVVVPEDPNNDKPFSMDIRVMKNGDVYISNVQQKQKLYPNEIKSKIGQTVKLPNGMNVTLLKPEWDATKYYNTDIHFEHSDLKAAAKKYSQDISANADTKKTSVITLSITNPSKQKAEDILTTLMELYNEQWLEDKNQVAVASSKFIDERLSVIEQELSEVENNISSFKSSNLLPNVDAASELYMKEGTDNNNAIYNLSNQIEMARLMRSELKSGGINEILPANAGIANSTIQNLMDEFNKLVLERNRLLTTSSEKNPIVTDITAELIPMRNNILRSLDAYINSLNAQMANAEARANTNVSKIAAAPEQEKQLLSIERLQKVKESLYMYLLQKREENQMSQAFTPYNTRIIEDPMGGNNPAFPNRTNVLSIAVMIGFMLPLLYFYLHTLFDNKIHSKKDLKNLSIPYLGEIPQGSNAGLKSSMAKKLKKTFKKKDANETHSIMVSKSSRNAVNESFRVLRTNLEFMYGSNIEKNGAAVIEITSANPGSGKTFIALNLASVLAIKDYKVLVIDLDLRRGSFSKYFESPKLGITDYLAGKADLSQILHHDVNNTHGYDVICMGSLPPNPAELLASAQLKLLVNDMRKEYDFILLDCPPVEIVTDALIINRIADCTMFVVRAGLLRRDMLPDIEEFYQSGRYQNMTIVLNGTGEANGYGYHSYIHKYGDYGYIHDSTNK